MRNRTFLLSSCSALSFVATLAGAQPPAPAANAKTVLTRPLAEAMTKKARELFSEGMQAAAQGKLADARAAFIGADALSPHYSNMCNLGDVDLRLGTFVDAANHLRTCTNGLQGDAKATAAEREGAKKLYETAKSKVAELAITTSVSGAKIAVDGAAVGTAPLAESVFAEAGKMTVSATLEGYEGAKVEVHAKAGVVLPVALTLKTVAPVVTATAGPSATAPVVAPRSKVPAFVIGGVGVASLIAAGVLYGAGVGKKGEVSSTEPRGADGKPVCPKVAPSSGADADPTCEKLRDLARDGNTLTNTGIAMFAAGGVVLAGAAVVLLWSSSTSGPQKSAARVVPIVSTDGAGLVWTGSF